MVHVLAGDVIITRDARRREEKRGVAIIFNSFLLFFLIRLKSLLAHPWAGGCMSPLPLLCTAPAMPTACWLPQHMQPRN